MDRASLALVIIGAINLMLAGLFKFDLFAAVLGDGTVLCRIAFSIIGLAGLWCVSLLFRKNGILQSDDQTGESTTETE